MKNTGGESLPAEGRNYAGTSINNENPAPPSTHREKVTLLRGSLVITWLKESAFISSYDQRRRRVQSQRRSFTVVKLSSFLGKATHQSP